MPFTYFTTSENMQSITRPIVIEVIRDLMSSLNIPKDVSVFYPGDNDKIAQVGSTINTTDRTARIETGRYVSTRIEDEYEEETLYTTAIKDDMQLPIFDDPNLGMRISPIYVQTRITISITYRTPSKTEIVRFRDDMYMRVVKGRNMFINTVKYHYPLDENIYQIIENCHDLRENIEGYGDTLGQYVVNNSTNRITLVSDLVNKNNNLVVSETQKRIVGLFDYKEFPDKPDFDETSQSYEIKLNYQFTFDRVIGWAMRYPNVVHNQLLPKEYTTYYDEDKIKQDYLSTPSSYQLPLYGLANFESDTIPYRNANVWKYIKLPHWDDFIFKSVPNYTATIVSALTLLEENNKKLLLNLNDLGPCAIDSDILQFMLESEAPYMTTIYRSVFLLHVYKNNMPLDYKACKLNSNGDLTFIKDQSLRNTFHVRLAVMLDLSLIQDDFFTRLLDYPKVAIKLFISLVETIKNFPGMSGQLTNTEGSGSNLGNLLGFLQQTGILNDDGTYNYDAPLTPIINRLKNLKDLLNVRNLDNYVIDSLVLTNYIVAQRY